MIKLRLYKLFNFLALLAILFSCTQNKEDKTIGKVNEDTLFSLVPSDSTGIDFINEIKNQKDFNIFKYRNFYNGGGVAIGDINNDGLPDIYMTSNMKANKLYLNKGNFKFEDISETAGVTGNKPWSTGVVMADVNGDGLLDIYVCNAGNMEGNNHNNDLYINNGDLTFTEKAKEYNLAKSGFTTHASFFDYDKDGDLDVYILNNSNIPITSLGYEEKRDLRAEEWENVNPKFRGVGDMLLRNDNGKFVNVSKESGIYGSLIGFGLGVMISDVNNDLYPDIYVSNDFYERDYLYINNRDGTFTEDIKNWTSHLSLSAMGIDMADINNDGNVDIFITDMLPEKDSRVKSVMEFEGYNVYRLKQSKDFYQQYIQNTLQLNNGNQSFSEIAYFSGVSATDWSWAGLLFDMDNDGLRDIFISNGINHDLTDLDFVDFMANDIIQKMVLTGRKEAVDTIIDKMPQKPQPNYAYKNNGDLTFKNANAEWGFELPSKSNGAAYADLDNDGDLDIVINNVNMPAFIYKNNSREKTSNNYLQLKLLGIGMNKFAVGSKVNLYYEDKVFVQELIPSRGFQSSVDYLMTIGLGDIKVIDSLRVIWPDSKTQKLNDVKTNQVLTLKQEEAKEFAKPILLKKQKTLLTEITPKTITTHKENPYNDFDVEGLINKQLSQEGPALAVGDVDNDGNEDFYIGGAMGYAGSLYLHKGNGNIIKSNQQIFEDFKDFEDTAASFFDVDNDNDLDLMIGSGGNQEDMRHNYRPRLYLNDGTGKFIDSKQNFALSNKNVSVIAPYDYDADGDIDVFIGSRSVVGIYGVNPEHLFMENDGNGIFSDVTERVAYDLKDAGMVTNAIWEDIDNDGKKDLITVSEWDTPKFYKNNGRRLSNIKTSLDNEYGMWNVVECADLDSDGDMDFIFGNQGTNIHYKSSKDNPMKLWINDFDNNGTIEQIMTLQENGKDYPLHMKKELTNQMVKLKKENLKASDYATRSIEELFSKEIIDNTIVKKVDISESIIAINDGNGKFSLKKLPTRVQLSCVCAVICTDINKDGLTDLIMAGNNYEFKPQYSRLDASYGNVLLNDKNLDFSWQDYSKSGFFIKNEVKHLKKLKSKDGKVYIVAAVNDDKPKIFAINE